MFTGTHLKRAIFTLFLCLGRGSTGWASPPPSLSAAATEALQIVTTRRDHGGAPFLVLDKVAAAIWVFDGEARLLGSTPVLVGAAAGDDSVPGIGSRPIAQIRPHERTTPAGRFRMEPGRNHTGEDIFWIDYDAAVSLHRLRPSQAVERRPARLASATPSDNRISYGCVNLPPAFYDDLVRPLFSSGQGVIYVLPETRSVRTIFPSATAAP